MPDLPLHLSGHSSAIINGKFQGTEVILTLGMAGSEANTHSYFFNVAKGRWRRTMGIPTTYKGEVVTFKNVWGNIKYLP